MSGGWQAGASRPGPLRLDEDDDDDVCIRTDILFARWSQAKGGGGDTHRCWRCMRGTPSAVLVC